MYVGRDFDPSDTGENERYTLDFVNDMQVGDTIASVAWTCSVAAKSENADEAAAGCISEAAIFNGSKTTQRVSGLKSGVIYTLRADIVTTNGDTVALWSHVECKAPA
jgi:hypothetical protein